MENGKKGIYYLSIQATPPHYQHYDIMKLRDKKAVSNRMLIMGFQFGTYHGYKPSKVHYLAN
jgi:glutamyl/glutaminyl-tRNA synthetase